MLNETCNIYHFRLHQQPAYMDETSQGAKKPVLAVNSVSNGIHIFVLRSICCVWGWWWVTVHDRRLCFSWRGWALFLHLPSTISATIWGNKPRNALQEWWRRLSANILVFLISTNFSVALDVKAQWLFRSLQIEKFNINKWQQNLSHFTPYFC